jgi:hypothetical protein
MQLQEDYEWGFNSHQHQCSLQRKEEGNGRKLTRWPRKNPHPTKSMQNVHSHQ